MNEACWKELSAFLDWVDQTPTLKAVIITGAGERPLWPARTSTS